MKYLLLLLFAMNVVACGNSKFSCQPNNCEAEALQPITGDDEVDSIELTASKTYHPDSSVDASHDVSDITEISLPSEIEVISGNAGNYYSLLKVDNDLTCFYKGGSNFSYPLQMGDVSEIEKGQKYHLDYCVDQSGNTLNLQAGDSLLVQSNVSLAIHNGDSTEDTVVKLVIDVL